MTWIVDLGPAVGQLFAIHWRAAERIGVAIRRFAASGEGDVEQVPDDPRLVRLRVQGVTALLHLVAKTRTIYVLAIFRS